MKTISGITLVYRRSVPQVGGIFRIILMRGLRQISMWYRVNRTRKQLALLSDEALADIGLTRDAALGEAMRPFWDSGDQGSFQR